MEEKVFSKNGIQNAIKLVIMWLHVFSVIVCCETISSIKYVWQTNILIIKKEKTVFYNK